VKAVLLGGTRGMGRALARLMAERGDAVALLGRRLDDLEKSARDLEVRAGAGTGTVPVATCDLERPETFAPALEAAEKALGGLDTVVVTAGAFATQDRLENDPERAREVLLVDFTNTILFCEEARRRLLAAVYLPTHALLSRLYPPPSRTRSCASRTAGATGSRA